MPSVLVVLIVAVAAGYLTGGRLAAVPRAGVRLSWLALLGFALQMLPISGLDTTTALTLLWVSFGSLTLFAVVNLRLPGFMLVLLGVVLNLTVIALNDGMPISPNALAEAGDAEQIAELEAGAYGVKYRLAEPDDQLVPLSDVIVLARPVGEVVSIGDLIIDGGLAWFLVAAMGQGGRRRFAAHRPPREQAAPSRDP